MDRSLISVRAIGQFENKRTPLPKDPNGLPILKKDIHFAIDKVKEIINSTLSANKERLIKNKDRVELSFIFWQESGEIENISYRLNGNTIVTLKDIAKIDREIKKNIKATFTGKEHPNFYLISYGMVTVEF